MDEQAVFSVLAQCFGPIEQDEWEALADTGVWGDFLSSLCALITSGRDDAAAGQQGRAASDASVREDLAARGLEALTTPPTFAEKHHFAATHFTGGLPVSAMPVESLYRPWRSGAATFSAAEGGCYGGDSARYVKDVVERLGMQVPPSFSAYPDHLALELDLVAVLLRSGMTEEARTFMGERFSWLAAYRDRLAQLEGAAFYEALIDAVLGICAAQGCPLSTPEHTSQPVSTVSIAI